MVIKLKNNHDAFMELSKNVATMYMNRSGNDFVNYEGNDFINTVGFAMHLRPDEGKLKEGSSGDMIFFSSKIIESIQHVLDAITNYGGSHPDMVIYPVILEIFEDDNLMNQVICLPLFRVRNKSNRNQSKYVDTNGRTYVDVDDFKNNVKYPPGEMAYPEGLIFSKDESGNAIVTWSDVNVSHTMEYIDFTANLACLGVGALAIFTGIGIPFAIASTAICGIYGVTRSAQVLVDRATHGESINLFNNWDSFNAWAGIASNLLGIGSAANGIHLSAQINQLAAEGLRISESTQLALRASVIVPYTINAGLMTVQFYQLAAFWDRIPVQHKIIIGLQFLFFAAASYKMNILSVAGLEERANNVVYNELREELGRIASPERSQNIKTALDQAIERLGGNKNYRIINFFKKLLNYKHGDVISTCGDETFSSIIKLAQENDELGFLIRQKYFCAPETVIQLNEELEAQRSGSSSTIQDEYSLPIIHASENQLFLNDFLETKRFVSAERIEDGQNWLKGRLNVDNLDEYVVNDTAIFKNMAYHDKMRLLIFEDIGESLNQNLIEHCLRYASDSNNVKTVGQFASEYEIGSLQLHKQANQLADTIREMNPATVEQEYNIKLQTRKETRMSYQDLPKERANILFADEPNQKIFTRMKREAINNIGKPDAAQIFENWKASIQTPNAKVLTSVNADLFTLANDIIELGDLSFPKAEYQATNAASFLSRYNVADIAEFPQLFLDDANATIQSCRGSLENRVFDATRPKDAAVSIRRLAFWSLEDENNAKSVVVSVNEKSKEVQLQNFTLKKIKTSSNVTRNAKEAVLEYWEQQFDYGQFKTTLQELISTIRDQCKEYVGAQIVRAGLTHDETVSDIQNLSSVRFASIEHAICHVLKHGEGLNSTEQLVTAVKDYFNKAQEVISATKNHPENVSSSWTQTGSVRDFFFYRKNLNGGGIEKVVVLVREGGEVIMKTYFVDKNLAEIPNQKKHSYQEPIDIKHASLSTFCFQLMLMAPRYGVILPKDYELFETDMDAEKTRTMIIMAAYYFEKDGSINTGDLAKAFHSAFPLNGVYWSVVAIRENSKFDYRVRNTGPTYMCVKIKNYFFIVFAEELSTKEEAIPKPGIIEVGFNYIYPQKYKGYSNNAEIQTSNGFNNDALDVVGKIFSKYDSATKITTDMDEGFGGVWHCFLLTNYNYDIYYQNCFVRAKFNNTIYVLFR